MEMKPMLIVADPFALISCSRVRESAPLENAASNTRIAYRANAALVFARHAQMVSATVRNQMWTADHLNVPMKAG